MILLPKIHFSYLWALIAFVLSVLIFGLCFNFNTDALLIGAAVGAGLALFFGLVAYSVRKDKGMMDDYIVMGLLIFSSVFLLCKR